MTSLWTKPIGFLRIVIAFLLRRCGTTGAFVYIAITMVLVFLVIGAAGPRTNRRRLEEIAH